MSGTGTYTAEDVRLALVAQVQTIKTPANVELFRHARLFFLGVVGQGAQIGDRIFDVQTGETAPLRANIGVEWVSGVYTVRLRHRTPTLASAEGIKLWSEDCDQVINRIRSGPPFPSDIVVRWVKRNAPVKAKDFVDTDLVFACQYWRSTTGGAP